MILEGWKECRILLGGCLDFIETAVTKMYHKGLPSKFIIVFLVISVLFHVCLRTHIYFYHKDPIKTPLSHR
jgi:hypothetical protein